MTQKIAEGRIVFGEDETVSPRYKRFLDDETSRSALFSSETGRQQDCTFAASSAVMYSSTRRTTRCSLSGSSRCQKQILMH